MFKFGVTVVILIAVYLYFAINYVGKDDSDDLSPKSVVIVDKDGVSVVKTSNTGDELQDGEKYAVQQASDYQNPRYQHGSIHICIVACGDRLEESLVLLKSAVLFTKSPLVFHIFAEDHLQKSFKDQLEFWPPAYRKKIEYNIYNITFPQTTKADQWRKLFKPCAAQRLFIPTLLPDVDAILYLDTDNLFLSPVDEIWSFFSRFNSSQLAAVSMEHSDPSIGWYNRFARHPYYGDMGMNSGVMLMNLTRLRQSSWLQAMENYYEEYKLKITWGDQDLINIYFHFYPHQLYIFSCEWNYRPDHCMYMSICEPVEHTGVYVLHGCRRVWHEDKQPAFKAIYTAYKTHDLGSSIEYDLLESLHKHLSEAPKSNCGNLKQAFLKQIQTYINSTKLGPR